MSLNRAEVEAVLTNLSPADLRRVKIMARTYAGGLIYLSWEDLIQETYTKLMSGERVFPEDVQPVRVIINAMHSEASNCREREQSGAIDHHVEVYAMSQSVDDGDDYDEDKGSAVVTPQNEVTPERILVARRGLSAIEALVADDADLQDVVTAWALGLKGQDAAEYLGWEMNQYEAARKRLVRRLETLKEE